MLISKYGVMAGQKKIQALYLDGSGKIEWTQYGGISKIVGEFIPLSWGGKVYQNLSQNAFISDELYKSDTDWNYNYVKNISCVYDSASGANPSDSYLGKVNKFELNATYGGNLRNTRLRVGENLEITLLNISIDALDWGKNYRNYTTTLLNGYIGYVLWMEAWNYQKTGDTEPWVWYKRKTFDFRIDNPDISLITNGQLVKVGI